MYINLIPARYVLMNSLFACLFWNYQKCLFVMDSSQFTAYIYENETKKLQCCVAQIPEYLHACDDDAIFQKVLFMLSVTFSRMYFYSSCWPAAQQNHCNTTILSSLLQEQVEIHPFFSIKIEFLCVVRNSTKNTSRRY